MLLPSLLHNLRGKFSVDLSVIGGPGQPLLALVFPDTHTSPYSPRLIFLHEFYLNSAKQQLIYSTGDQGHPVTYPIPLRTVGM